MRHLFFFLMGFLLVPVVLHSLFHLLDWMVWGLGMEPTELRAVLLPFFQDTTALGLAVHAGVNVATLVALGILLAVAWSHERMKMVWGRAEA